MASGVKIGLMFANAGPFGERESAKVLAKASEEFGVESLWTVEHVVVPVGYESAYPYAKGGKMPGPEESSIPDPLAWLSFMAAITETVKLATGILLLPQRHPLYVAKEVATIDRLSNGRLLLGIGIGWMQEEFDALGIPFDERVGRTEESVEALRSLWSPGASDFHGKFYNWNACHSNPKPHQSGGVPVVVGGHVKGAARRAGRLGDGFFPAKGSIDQMKLMLDEMRGEAKRVGRDASAIELTTMPDLRDHDHLRALIDLGFTRFVTGPPGYDEDGLRKGLDKLMGLAASL